VHAAVFETSAHYRQRPRADSARAELVRLTKDVHAALHRHPSFIRLMSETLTMREYRCLLCKLYGFHSPLESVLGDNAGSNFSIDIAARAKSPLLRADLVSLGMTCPEVDLIEKCPCLPFVRSPDEIIGALYVVEGAGLGGKIIARKLNYLLGDDASAGRQFFLGRPDPDPLPWADFCRSLECLAATGSLATITQSALHTFEALKLWLDVGEHGV
jgi:heme oxygenase